MDCTLHKQTNKHRKNNLFKSSIWVAKYLHYGTEYLQNDTDEWIFTTQQYTTTFKHIV
jgi:hypothetical protein